MGILGESVLNYHENECDCHISSVVNTLTYNVNTEQTTKKTESLNTL